MTEIITNEYDGILVRDYLSKVLKFSHGMMKKVKFRENGITVNGSFVTVRYVLHEGDVLRLLTDDRDEDTCPYMIPVDLPIGIAYESDDITVVDKPPRMPAHPSLAHRLDTVANALAFRYPDAPFVFRPVNRLDRDTSGLMMTARNRLSASKMYEEMIGGRITKMYVALTENCPSELSGIIDAPIRRAEDSIMERRVTDESDEKGKPARTYYKVIGESNGITAVLVAPLTGRTHQIRVHFSSIGSPLVGDTMYGGDERIMQRHALHAAHLSFTTPCGEYIKLYSPLPDDMKTALGEGASAIEEKIRAAIYERLTEMQNEKN